MMRDGNPSDSGDVATRVSHFIDLEMFYKKRNWHVRPSCQTRGVQLSIYRKS